MPFVPAVLQALDTVRCVGGLLGLRVIRTTVTRRVWTGRVPGEPGSSKSDTTVLLTNRMPNGTEFPVRVRQVSRGEAIASGGQYTNRDLKVGPMTPSYAATVFGAAGGWDDHAVDPEPSSSAVQMIWKMQGDGSGTFGLPADGVVCEKRGQESTALHVYVILRATGRKAST